MHHSTTCWLESLHAAYFIVRSVQARGESLGHFLLVQRQAAAGSSGACSNNGSSSTFKGWEGFKADDASIKLLEKNMHVDMEDLLRFCESCRLWQCIDN